MEKEINNQEGTSNLGISLTQEEFYAQLTASSSKFISPETQERFREAHILIAGVGSVRDFISGLPSIPLIENGACLYFTWLASTTAPPQVYCSLHFVDC